MHLGEIEDSIAECQALIDDLESKDLELGDSIGSQISAHNTSEKSHLDIRAKITEVIGKHSESALSHADIREKMRELEKALDSTYAIASGKSRVYTFYDILEMLEFLNSGVKVNLGDVLLVADPDSPDFTVYDVEAEARMDDIVLTYENVSSAEVMSRADKSYLVGNVRLISTEGNLETSRLAKREEIERIEGELYEYIERTDDALSSQQSAIECKENMLVKTTNSDTCVEILSNHEYDLGLREELYLSIMPSSGFSSIVNFRSGAKPTMLDVPLNLIFQGDDTLDGVLYPISNRIYEINIKEVLGVLIARVFATDYEVIE